MPLHRILASIAAPLASVDDAIRTACETTVPTITQVVQHIIAGGGKRLRPALTLLCAEQTGYAGTAAPWIGAALEMIHTASLLHDDVIDNATVRRGRQSVNAAWGNQVSVLVGDFFWCRACQLIIQHGSPAMLHTITDAIAATTEGEILELMKSHDVSMTEQEYLHILEHKTARLIGVSCEAGVMLGTASVAVRRAATEYGLALGIAFQLADDVLDYTATATEFGKELGTDLREGRLTMPLIHALQHATAAERAMIQRCIAAGDISDDDLSQIHQVLDHHQGIPHTQQLARHYVERAQRALQSLPRNPARDALFALADYSIERKV